MNKQFKPGPAKLRNHATAYVCATGAPGECPVVGVYQDRGGGWVAFSRQADGKFPGRDELDLMPNVEPEKYTFECTWNQSVLHIHPQFDSLASLKTLTGLVGKRTRVEITVLDDESES